MDSTDSYPKEYADSAWFKRLGEFGFPMGGNTYDGTRHTRPHSVKTWSDPVSRQELYRAYLVRPCGGNAAREVGYHLWPVQDAEGNFQSWAWTAKWPGWNGKRDAFPLSKGDLWAYWPMAESGIDRLPDFPCEYFSQPIEEGVRRFALVCALSGYRRRGITERLMDTANFTRAVHERAKLLFPYLFFENYAQSMNDFFEEAVSICQEIQSGGETLFESASPMGERMVSRILELCGNHGEKLNAAQNENRLLLTVLHNIPQIQECLGFTSNWISDNELFFENLKLAVRHLFEPSAEALPLYPWLGDSCHAYLLFSGNN